MIDNLIQRKSIVPTQRAKKLTKSQAGAISKTASEVSLNSDNKTHRSTSEDKSIFKSTFLKMNPDINPKYQLEHTLKQDIGPGSYKIP